jgi:hypothetical protein
MIEALFPFSYPFPTALYLTLYVVTLCIHVVFMNYVLCGSCWIALSLVVKLSRKEGLPPKESPYGIFVDWLPFFLSGAITAGIGPLLFLQILYKEQFYTANLLLHWKWMTILPILILGFYALYLLKSSSSCSVKIHLLFGCIATICFCLVAFLWTENHLLSINRDVWVSTYESPRLLYLDPHLLPRLSLWAFGALPTGLTLLSWQLHHNGASLLHQRSISSVALLGIVLSGCSGFWYYSLESNLFTSSQFKGLAVPYLILAIVGIIMQIMCWIQCFLRKTISLIWLLLTTIGCLMTIGGMTVVREAVRLSKINISAHSTAHAALFSQGGVWIFVTFLLLGLVTVGWCLAMVKNATTRE